MTLKITIHNIAIEKLKMVVNLNNENRRATFYYIKLKQIQKLHLHKCVYMNTKLLQVKLKKTIANVS